MPQRIGIFNAEWECEAIIDVDQVDLPVQYISAGNSVLISLVEQLRTRPAESLQPQKDESGCVTGFVTRKYGEVGYAQAVADECKRIGLRSVVVEADLFPLLQQLPTEARSQVLPEVLFMDHDVAQEVLGRMVS